MSDVHGPRNKYGWGVDAASRQFAAQYGLIWQAIAKMMIDNKIGTREFDACKIAMALDQTANIELAHVILQGFPPTKAQCEAFYRIPDLPWFVERVRVKLVEVRVS